MRLFLALMAATTLVAWIATFPAVPESLVFPAWSLALIAIMLCQLARALRVQGHILAARLGMPRRRANRRFVESLFDQYADDYEEHLTKDLRYNAAPALALALELHAVSRSALTILDLGCGSGLLARHLDGRSARLVGIDVSSRMLEKAGRLGLYDELVHADIERCLQNMDEQFDAVLAADTLVYLGDLGKVFAGARARLLPGGLFLFTTEKAVGGSYIVRKTGRFAHSEPYLRALAAKNDFERPEITTIRIRDEGDSPVMGWLFAARLPAGEDRQTTARRPRGQSRPETPAPPA